MIPNILYKTSMIVGEESMKEYTENKLKEDSWWYPSTNGKKRVMLCGTYPIGTSNGYSKVVYYISKYLGQYKDIELTIYGFQNFANTSGANIRNEIPSNVKLHDAMATENPKRSGFGEKEIGDYIKKNPQDIIIIFNDNMITTALTATIINECGRFKNNFKLISYMDQVYPYQKKEYLNLLNTYFDGIIAFTPYWADIARKLGIKETLPIYCFPHGFDDKVYYPIPMKLARNYFKYNDDDFMVLNLNRNQPRKRLDIAIIAWAEFVEKHYQINVKNVNKSKITSRPIKLIIGTTMDGFWDIMDIFENEIKFRDVPWEYAKNTIKGVDNPQQISDRDINILYNACDVGLNCADGEGFGLCGFEGAALGKAQISANIGGMREFLNNDIAILVDPKISIYLDNKGNGIPGKAEIGEPREYAEAFWKYFSSPDLVKKHGIKSRKHILTHYRWETVVDYFYKKTLLKLI